MNKNNILNHSNNVKPYDWGKIINNSDNITDEELIYMIKNQLLPEKNQLNVTTINTETQPQKEKVKKKCKIKCGCPCKKRIEELEDQVDYLTDMVEFLMEDSELFYNFMNNHMYKKREK